MSTKRKAVPKRVATPDPARRYVALGLMKYNSTNVNEKEHIETTCLCDTESEAAQEYRDSNEENPWLVVEINPSWIRNNGVAPVISSGKVVKLA